MERIQKILTQQRSDAGYVRHLFDQFSADYDARMRGQLAYQAPEVLRALADLVMPGAHGLTVLDLGCGTGLAGAAFADIAAAAIDGIDLSPAMIARARERLIYRSLAVGDLETVLGTGGANYDLILAADTLGLSRRSDTDLCRRRSSPEAARIFSVHGGTFSAGRLRPRSQAALATFGGVSARARDNGPGFGCRRGCGLHATVGAFRASVDGLAVWHCSWPG